MGSKYGDEDYGSFSHHGAYYKKGLHPNYNHVPLLHDSDFGIKYGGVPENVHNHFHSNGGYKHKSYWNPFPKSQTSASQ